MNLNTTPHFLRELKHLAKKYPSIKNELAELGASLRENPTQGTFIGRDCYKIRLAIASKGRGKSGGGRVITCVKVLRDTIFLISIYDKSERENLPDHELDEILEQAGLSPEG